MNDPDIFHMMLLAISQHQFEQLFGTEKVTTDKPLP